MKLNICMVNRCTTNEEWVIAEQTAQLLSPNKTGKE